MNPMMAFAAVSMGFQAFNNWKSRKEQEKAYEQQAQIFRLRADELLERNSVNNELDREEFRDFEANTIVENAAKGLSLSGSSMGALNKASYLVTEKIIRDTREAEFEANMLKLGEETNLRDSRAKGAEARYSLFAEIFSSGSQVHQLYSNEKLANKYNKS